MSSRIGTAVIAGLLGGVVFGMMMQMILMPILLGMPAFAPLVMPPMRMVAAGSLIGHLVFGVILGGAFVWLYRGVHDRAPARA